MKKIARKSQKSLYLPVQVPLTTSLPLYIYIQSSPRMHAGHFTCGPEEASRENPSK